MRAPAKINLQLAVGPLRDDGYHDLVTVFQAVSLYDEVTAAIVDGPGEDVVGVSGEGADSVPAGPDNLALRAATALAQVAGLSPDPGRHLEITIRKRIPVAAGLAGGSADAAAALVACNELWQAGLSIEQLSGIAAGVGASTLIRTLAASEVTLPRVPIQVSSSVARPRRCSWSLGPSISRFRVSFSDGHAIGRVTARSRSPETK